MNVLERIDTLGTDLRAEVRNAGPDQLRSIAVAMAELASRDHPELPSEFRHAVELLRAGKTNSDVRARITATAEQLDDVYLEMHWDEKPGGQTPGWEGAFATARAAAAIVFALDPNPLIAAAESTYEAVIALDDEMAVLAVVVATKPRRIHKR